jgi:hypothetical protein
VGGAPEVMCQGCGAILEHPYTVKSKASSISQASGPPIYSPNFESLLRTPIYLMPISPHPLHLGGARFGCALARFIASASVEASVSTWFRALCINA